MAISESFHNIPGERYKYQVMDLINCLATIDDRISSEKEGSRENCLHPILGCSIDKLNIYSRNAVFKEEVLERARNHGYNVSTFYGNGSQRFLEISNEEKKILLKDNSYINSAISNPSRFKDWDEYSKFVRPIFNLFQDSKISRCDLALDFNISFLHMKNSLFVSRTVCKCH